MSSIVRATELLSEELEMLGQNILHAVKHDGEEQLLHSEAESRHRAPDGVTRLSISPTFPNPFPRPAA